MLLEFLKFSMPVIILIISYSLNKMYERNKKLNEIKSKFKWGLKLIEENQLMLGTVLEHGINKVDTITYIQRMKEIYTDLLNHANNEMVIEYLSKQKVLVHITSLLFVVKREIIGYELDINNFNPNPNITETIRNIYSKL